MATDPAIAHSLDHVGIAGADLDALSAQYAALGFTLTPLARHSGRRSPDGPVVPFGTGNRCVMLRQGYLELIAIVDPVAFSNTLDRFLARYAGIHILALGIADEAANLARLRAAGFDLPGIAYLERPVDDADPAGPKARFARLPIPDPTDGSTPEGRLQLIRHLTPEAIWQERFLRHANGAEALEEVVMAAADPATTTARLARMAGLPAQPDGAGGFILALPRGRLRVTDGAHLPDILPGAAAPTLPFIAGITLRTGDANRAAAVWFAAHGIDHRIAPDGTLIVPAQAAGGAVLRFVGGANA